MAIETAKVQDFSRGMTNTVPDNRVPDGFLRDTLNLEPRGSTLSLRAGYKKIVDGADVNSVMSLGNQIIFLDGDTLKKLDLNTNTVDDLLSVNGAGGATGVVLNGELFFQTRDQMLRYDGNEIRQWGVPDVLSQPVPTVSSTTAQDQDKPEEKRLFAMTWVNSSGEEGGTTAPILINSTVGSYSVSIPSKPGFSARLYFSEPGGQILYSEGEATPGGTVTVSRPEAVGPTLQNVGLRQVPKGSHMATTGGIICIADGSNVFITEPFQPHLYDPATGFVQYPKKIGMLLSGSAGVYVSSDECYLLTNLETENIQQRTVLNYPAVSGTGTEIADGRAVWVTKYGLAVESSQDGVPVIEEPSKQTFSPPPAETGVLGYFEVGGRQMAVSSLSQRSSSAGQLAASDFFEAEVVKK